MMPTLNSTQRHPARAPRFGRAVVIGGSITGLVTARILSEHFERVTVLERDEYPARPVPRRGVPQGNHIHIVLARGRRELVRLFPSLPRDLDAAGAVRFDYGRGAELHYAEGALAHFDSDLVVQGCTRPLLDLHVLRYVQGMPNVTVLQGRRALGLASTADRRALAGVRVEGSEGAQEVIPADFVVDACGRQSRAETWLGELGYEAPAESTVDSGLTYACCLYAPKPHFRADWAVLSSAPRAPDRPRSAAIFAVEGNRWLACVASMGRDRPPADAGEYLAFTRTLANPAVFEALSNAEPVGRAIRSGTTSNRLRHYERLERFPDGFAVVGDAVCAMNPLYGQGITLLVLGALALGEELQEQRARGLDLRGLGMRYQRRVAKNNRAFWRSTTGADAQWPNTRRDPAPSPALSAIAALPRRALRAYAKLAMEAAASSPRVAREMMEVAHMEKSPLAVLGPGLALEVLARALSGAPARSESAAATPATSNIEGDRQ